MAKTVAAVVKLIDQFSSPSAKIRTQARDLERSFKRVGDVFSNMGGIFSSAGSALTSKITAPALGAASALAGISLAKGWARMQDIDNAKVKLEAIGNSAQDVAAIMENATASVKGTAYGLNEAAQTAASAVAAGITPGEKLEGYLTAIGDAAAVAGTDMASMGAVFNKVATQGKASNEVLQQLAEAGIPIYQYLADEIGVTSDAITDMASDGAISLEQFQGAVTSHIGGAAKTIGSKTISGAISNVQASLSRIGANFLGSADNADSFAGRVLPLLNSLMDHMGALEDTSARWGAVFGEVFGGVIDYCKLGELDFSKLSDTAGSILGKLTPLIDKVKDIKAAFDSLSPTMQKTMIAGVLGAGPLLTIAGKILSLTGTSITDIGKVGGALKRLSAGSYLEKLNFSLPIPGAKKLSGAVGSLQGKFGGLSKGMNAVGTNRFTKGLGSLAKAAASPLSIFGKLGSTVAGFGKTLMGVATGPVGLAIAAGILLYRNWDAVSPALKGLGVKFGELWEKVQPLVTQFMELMDTLSVTVLPLLDKVFVVVFSGIVGFMEGGFLEPVITIVEGVTTVFKGLTDFLSGVFTGDWEKALGGIKTIFSGVFESLVGIAKAPMNGVIGVINGVVDAVNRLQIKIPKWSPWHPGETFGINIPKLSYLYTGTDNWKGGPAVINDRGGEIVDLPKGTRVYPHDESIKKAREEGKGNRSISLKIAKLADQIIVREDADIDRIAAAIVKKLEETDLNMA